MSENEPTSDVAALTVQLLSAYLANNSVASENLGDLIRSTRTALTDSLEPAAADLPSETFTPAVSVKKSLASPEHIISLIDGKPYKTLKRHLASHGLTPDTYRSRYNLPVTYPMVAPAYAAHRREVAQKFGLGNKRPAAAEDQHIGADAVVKSLTRTAADDTTINDEKTQSSRAKSGSKVSGASRSKCASSRRDGDAQPTDMKSGVEAKAEVVAAPDEPSSATSQAPAPERPKPARKTKATARQTETKSARASKPADQLAAAPVEKNADVVSPTSSTSTEVPAKTPKRRAKIGLFSKTNAAQPEVGEVQAAFPAADKNSGMGEGGKLAGQKKPKRMARSPKDNE
jgi:predicted transcriptional regulator